MENSPEKQTAIRTRFKETSLFLLDILYNAVIIIVLVVLIRSFLVSPFRVVGYSMADTLDDKEFILIDKLSYIVGDIDRGDPIVFLPPIMGGNLPKFEEKAKANSQGIIKVKIDNLETTKPTSYCQNQLLQHFWLCKTSPTENDQVYYTADQREVGQTTPEADWNGSKSLILNKVQLEQGYLELTGEADKSYNIRIYDSKGPEYFVKRVLGIPGDTIKIENGRVYLKTPDQEEFIEMEEPFLNKDNTQQTYANRTSEENIFTVPEGHYFVMGDNRNHSNDSRSWLDPVTLKPISFVPAENISGKVFVVLWPLNHMRFVKGANF